MAALVQSYPQQSGTVTMLQTRPASTASMLPTSPSQVNQQYMGGSQQQRNGFHAVPSGMGGPSMYRASPSPIQPYAFTSTPSLNTNTQWQQFGGFRTSSSPTVPTIQSLDQGNGGRPRYVASTSMTNLAYNPTMGLGKSGSRDDSSIRPARTVTTAPRPQSAYMSGTSTQLSFVQTAPVKASPDRYRRPAAQQPRVQNSAPPSGSGMSSVSHLYSSQGGSDQKRPNIPSLPSRPRSSYIPGPGSAADDMQLQHQPSQEEGKRLRRRSMHTLDSADYPKPLTPQVFSSPEESSRLQSAASPKNADKEQKTLRLVPASGAVDTNMRVRNGSSESLVSTRSTPSSNSRPSSVSAF
jgi:hypothetical protein